MLQIDPHIYISTFHLRNLYKPLIDYVSFLDNRNIAAEKNKCVFKYIFTAALKCVFSFIGQLRVDGKLLKMLMPTYS
jgi:hypothetical protein